MPKLSWVYLRMVHIMRVWMKQRRQERATETVPALERSASLMNAFGEDVDVPEYRLNALSTWARRSPDEKREKAPTTVVGAWESGIVVGRTWLPN